MADTAIIDLSAGLEKCGLQWEPAIGDEVAERESLEKISILVDPQGLSPCELRECFIWVPTVEQLVEELEERGAMICHAGMTERRNYSTLIRYEGSVIEAEARTLRSAFLKALQNLISNVPSGVLH